jgi:hypothetical protein
MHILRGTARALAGGGAAAEAADPLLTGLVAWYRNNGTNRAATGAANNLTPFGSPTTAAGVGAVANSAMSIPTGGDGFSIAAALVAAAPMSLSFWFKRAAAADAVYVVQADGGSARVMLATYDSEGALTGFDGTANASLSGSLDDSWHHAVVTTDGVTVTSYYDGALANAEASVPTTGAETFSVTCQSEILYEAVGVWSRALSAGEVTTLYGAGSGSPAYDPTA